MNSKNIKLLLISFICFNIRFIIAQDAESKVTGQSSNLAKKYTETDMYYTPKTKEALAYYNQGHDYFNDTKYKNSIPCYMKALEIEPDFVDAMDNLGNSYGYLTLYDSAEYWYNKSIKLYSNNFVAHQNLASVYVKTSRLDKTLNEYDLLTKLDTANAEGYFGKAKVNVKLNKGQEVVTNAQKARELYNKNHDPYEKDAVLMMGVGYYIQKNNESAKKYVKEAKDMGAEIPEGLKKLLQ